MSWADEGDLFESLVASERVADWLDTACGEGAVLPVSARLAAASSLATECARDRAYAEEADAAGAEAALLAAAEAATCGGQDELAAGLCTAADAVARARCAAESHAEQQFTLPDGAGAVRLRTPAQSGVALGLRVWDSAPRLVARLASQPLRRALHSASVLELGAGAGLAGLAALLLGAREVTLTDTPAAPGVLQLLAANAALNPQPVTGALARVRALDWACDAGKPAGAVASSTNVAPPLEAGTVFDIVIGSDVLYHSEHAALLPRVLASRLARPRAVAHLLCPVRDERALAAFEAHAQQMQLHVSVTRERDAEARYEGGYARIDVSWAKAV